MEVMTVPGEMKRQNVEQNQTVSIQPQMMPLEMITIAPNIQSLSLLQANKRQNVEQNQTVIFQPQMEPLEMIIIAPNIQSLSLLPTNKSWRRTGLKTIYQSIPGRSAEQATEPTSTTSSKGAKDFKKKKWDTSEVKAVEKQSARKKKKECEDCIKAEPVALKDRDWLAVKVFVKNLLKRRYKKISISFLFYLHR